VVIIGVMGPDQRPAAGSYLNEAHAYHELEVTVICLTSDCTLSVN